jgi:hypothetical protein
VLVLVEELVVLAEQIQVVAAVDVVLILLLVAMEAQVLLSSHTLAHKYLQVEL